MSRRPSVLVLDGHSYLFRAYYGIPEAVRLPDGRQGNAVYGFFAALRRAVRHAHADAIVVVFDSETGLRAKQAIAPLYKALRTRAVPQMFTQLDVIKALLTHLDIPAIEDPDHEADDIVGSIATLASQSGARVCIASGDRDFLQLLSPTVGLLVDGRGAQKILTPAWFRRHFPFAPSSYADYLALKGDPSDNLSGVPGVGPARAASGLRQYRDIEGMIAAGTVVLCGRRFDMGRHARLLWENRALVTINTTIDTFQWAVTRYANPSALLACSTNEILSRMPTTGS